MPAARNLDMSPGSDVASNDILSMPPYCPWGDELHRFASKPPNTASYASMHDDRTTQSMCDGRDSIDFSTLHYSQSIRDGSWDEYREYNNRSTTVGGCLIVDRNFPVGFCNASDSHMDTYGENVHNMDYSSSRTFTDLQKPDPRAHIPYFDSFASTVRPADVTNMSGLQAPISSLRISTDSATSIHSVFSPKFPADNFTFMDDSSQDTEDDELGRLVIDVNDADMASDNDDTDVCPTDSEQSGECCRLDEPVATDLPVGNGSDLIAKATVSSVTDLSEADGQLKIENDVKNEGLTNLECCAGSENKMTIKSKGGEQVASDSQSIVVLDDPAVASCSTALHNTQSNAEALPLPDCISTDCSVEKSVCESDSQLQQAQQRTMACMKRESFLSERMLTEWPAICCRVGAGLQNLGNTCFVNATVQCLTYTVPLVNYLFKYNHSSSCLVNGMCLMCEMEQHIKHCFDNSGSIVRPQSMLQKLKVIARHMRWGRQEDAHEFLRYMVEAMHKSCISGHQLLPERCSKDASVVNEIFGGYLLTCLQCHAKSNTFDPFLDISLDVKNVSSIVRALERFVEPETLDTENAYNCTKCRGKVRAQKRFTLHKLPHVLTIQLKRYGMMGGKVTRHIVFPEVLDVRPYVSPLRRATTGAVCNTENGNSCLPSTQNSSAKDVADTEDDDNVELPTANPKVDSSDVDNKTTEMENTEISAVRDSNREEAEPTLPVSASSSSIVDMETGNPDDSALRSPSDGGNPENSSGNPSPAIDYKYRLYGVLVHEGHSTNSGHYYCYVMTASGAWYCFNDHIVRKSSLSQVLNAEAYLLFYSRGSPAAVRRPTEQNCKDVDAMAGNAETSGVLPDLDAESDVPTPDHIVTTPAHSPDATDTEPDHPLHMGPSTSPLSSSTRPLKSLCRGGRLILPHRPAFVSVCRGGRMNPSSLAAAGVARRLRKNRQTTSAAVTAAKLAAVGTQKESLTTTNVCRRVTRKSVAAGLKEMEAASREVVLDSVQQPEEAGKKAEKVAKVVVTEKPRSKVLKALNGTHKPLKHSERVDRNGLKIQEKSLSTDEVASCSKSHEKLVKPDSKLPERVRKEVVGSKVQPEKINKEGGLKSENKDKENVSCKLSEKENVKSKVEASGKIRSQQIHDKTKLSKIPVKNSDDKTEKKCLEMVVDAGLKREKTRPLPKPTSGSSVERNKTAELPDKVKDGKDMNPKIPSKTTVSQEPEKMTSSAGAKVLEGRNFPTKPAKVVEKCKTAGSDPSKATSSSKQPGPERVVDVEKNVVRPNEKVKPSRKSEEDCSKEHKSSAEVAKEDPAAVKPRIILRIQRSRIVESTTSSDEEDETSQPCDASVETSKPSSNATLQPLSPVIRTPAIPKLATPAIPKLATPATIKPRESVIDKTPHEAIEIGGPLSPQSEARPEKTVDGPSLQGSGGKIAPSSTISADKLSSDFLEKLKELYARSQADRPKKSSTNSSATSAPKSPIVSKSTKSQAAGSKYAKINSSNCRALTMEKMSGSVLEQPAANAGNASSEKLSVSEAKVTVEGRPLHILSSRKTGTDDAKCQYSRTSSVESGPKISPDVSEKPALMAQSNVYDFDASGDDVNDDSCSVTLGLRRSAGLAASRNVDQTLGGLPTATLSVPGAYGSLSRLPKTFSSKTHTPTSNSVGGLKVDVGAGGKTSGMSPGLPSSSGSIAKAEVTGEIVAGRVRCAVSPAKDFSNGCLTTPGAKSDTSSAKLKSSSRSNSKTNLSGGGSTLTSGISSASSNATARKPVEKPSIGSDKRLLLKNRKRLHENVSTTPSEDGSSTLGGKKSKTSSNGGPQTLPGPSTSRSENSYARKSSHPGIYPTLVAATDSCSAASFDSPGSSKRTSDCARSSKSSDDSLPPPEVTLLSPDTPPTSKPAGLGTAPIRLKFRRLADTAEEVYTVDDDAGKKCHDDADDDKPRSDALH